MATPLSLLKTAVSESPTGDRTAFVIKACKQITDILPFAQKGQSLLDEPELIKYLMLSIPLNPRSVEWIVSSMIDKFKHNNMFLKNLWMAFQAIAFLSERDNVERKSVHGLKLFQLGVKKALNIVHIKKEDKTLDTQFWSDEKFCEEINSNKEMIKTSCLDNVKKFSDLYTKELKDFMSFEPDLGGLLKKFIGLTYSQKVVVKTVQIVEDFRKEGKIKLDHEIEELLAQKQNLLHAEAPKEERPNRPSRFGRASTLVVSTANKGSVPRTEAIVEYDFSNYDHNKKSAGNVKKWGSLIGDVLSPKFKERESMLREQMSLQKIEQWLAETEIGQSSLVNGRTDVLEYMAYSIHFENVLSFIFEPDSHPLAPCWKQNYSSLISQSEEDRELYVLRSFKTMQALSDEKNFMYLFGKSKENLEAYFHHVHQNWDTKSEHSCNLNHIGTLTEALVRQDPGLCVGFILHYNLLYKFIQNIENQFIQQLLVTLFKSSANAKDIDTESYRKLLRYCESSSLFPDLAQAILYGWNAFDSNKFTLGYKPPGIKDLVTIALEGEETMSEMSESQYRPSSNSKEKQLLEELNDFEVDIDYLQPVLQNNRSQVTTRQSLPQSQQSILSSQPQRSNPNRVKQKPYSNYPSLTENTMSTRDISVSEEQRAQETLRPTLTSLDLSEDKKASHKEVSSSIPKKVTGRKSQQLAVLAVPQKSKDSLPRTSLPQVQSRKSILKETSNIIPNSEQKTELSSINKARPRPTKMLNFDSEVKPSLFSKRDTEFDREVIMKKGGRSTHSDKENLTRNSIDSAIQVSSPSVKFTDLSNISRSQKSRASILGANKPIKRTVHKELDLDVLDQEKVKELEKVYVTPVHASTDIELEAVKADFGVRNLRENDHFSVALCEFLQELFRKAVSKVSSDIDGPEKKIENLLGVSMINEIDIELLKAKYELKRNIGSPSFDPQLFWQSVFTSDCMIFEQLLKNYLFKIKIHHLEEINSGYISGLIVNLILEECAKGDSYFEPYKTQIQSICKKHFSFLCKTIVQSYAWLPKKNLKVYLQDYQVQNPLGSGRLLLAQTLKLVIENDHANDYKLTGQMDDTCWHVLTHWFFMNKTNNIYHNLFYAMLEVAFLNNSESFITNILFRLGLLSNMYKTWSEIYQSNMLRLDQHIDSILYHLKKFVSLIDYIVQENTQYRALRRELKKSISWEIVKGGIFSLKGVPFDYQSGNALESEIKSGGLFSPAFPSRYKKSDQTICESISSKTDIGDKIGNENLALRELERELCK